LGEEMARQLKQVWRITAFCSGPTPMTDSEIVSFIENRGLTPEEIGVMAGLINEEQDCYTILGVEPTASLEDINRAYCQAIRFFHPARRVDLTQSDAVLHWKLSCALKRIEEAYSILSSSVRRKVYDAIRSESLLLLEGRPEVIDAASATCSPASIHNAPNRRRVERLRLRLPALVTLERRWQETTESEDVSPLGILIRLSRSIEPGTLLRLQLPMPATLRTRSCDSPLYIIDGFAIRILEEEEKRLVAIEFV